MIIIINTSTVQTICFEHEGDKTQSKVQIKYFTAIEL